MLRSRLESLRSRTRPASDPRERVHVLHVGKTGGTALNHVLDEHQSVLRYQPVLGGHEATLAGVPVGERFMFFIRDPLSRFVSAFNSRLREGRPRYHYPWREEERVAFAVFKTPDQLATALSSIDPVQREQAEQAMRGIGHLSAFYSFWFGDEAAFRARLPDLFFIGFQERLDDDFELLKQKFGLPPEAQLPRGEAAHQAPAGYDAHLGETARANLQRWYADDLVFVELCRELAPRVNALKA
jgi:Sulfotransferase family